MAERLTIGAVRVAAAARPTDSYVAVGRWFALLYAGVGGEVSSHPLYLTAGLT